ncbi:hypothetical protein BU23DRAFT_560668 [Bimuria novae-zelandiae CBS 107.79]|uniref:Homeobox domain-containing protein n=1 Tax=Bimuria novae-zelandiae CBS 107.79 TaxID=1447943 RepID=A0A6A5UY22_9PLEO|nr:hypothetical protein BU23DRAFT_560668 [Bimuria novae-zelandiae CBS 107.79]
MPSSPIPSSSPSRSSDFAFLNHSPTTVANSLPPDVDNKPLARQKRRRTSKEDEEILKTEYAKNPKPDKAARIEIVGKVALGEKEVQIWFQNRRQNDRRRARPLDPAASLMSSSSTMSDPVSEEDTMGRDNSPAAAERTQVATPHRESAEPIAEVVEATESAKPAEPAELVGEMRAEEQNEASKEPVRAISEEAVADSPEPEKLEAEGESQATVDSSIIPSTDPKTVDTAPTELSSSQQNASSSSFSSSSQGATQSRTNWISNRRSASFMRSAEDYAPEIIAFPHPTQAAQKTQAAPENAAKPPTKTRVMKRAHSFVRISTNEDGTARVVTDLDKTPSPPHPRTTATHFARAAAGLRRSYSAAGLNDRLATAQREERSPKIPRTSPFGRSRDSRAWEFWCDPDTRYNTSLMTRAEQEGSGSAADAIGLLRANRRILQQNQARQNTPVKRTHSAKMSPCSSGVKKSRGPMQRASTINGRLQSKSKCSDSSETDYLENDSDKENWEPMEFKSQPRPRAVRESPAVQRTRKILGENTEIMSQSNSLGAMLDKSGVTPSRKRSKKTSDPEQDDELRAFMGGEPGVSARPTVSSAEEAGCVEGLLKLSQGQWR